MLSSVSLFLDRRLTAKVNDGSQSSLRAADHLGRFVGAILSGCFTSVSSARLTNHLSLSLLLPQYPSPRIPKSTAGILPKYWNCCSFIQGNQKILINLGQLIAAHRHYYDNALRTMAIDGNYVAELLKTGQGLCGQESGALAQLDQQNADRFRFHQECGVRLGVMWTRLMTGHNRNLLGVSKLMSEYLSLVLAFLERQQANNAALDNVLAQCDGRPNATTFANYRYDRIVRRALEVERLLYIANVAQKATAAFKKLDDWLALVTSDFGTHPPLVVGDVEARLLELMAEFFNEHFKRLAPYDRLLSEVNSLQSMSMFAAASNNNLTTDACLQKLGERHLVEHLVSVRDACLRNEVTVFTFLEITYDFMLPSETDRARTPEFNDFYRLINVVGRNFEQFRRETKEELANVKDYLGEVFHGEGRVCHRPNGSTYNFDFLFEGMLEVKAENEIVHKLMNVSVEDIEWRPQSYLTMECPLLGCAKTKASA